ncbi:GyrI-like domain-containing protein [Paenibacillus mesophilus]|uniref:GyrI-like domain-containing protein n=1 Tax=Paenibacillus mesophilus TaxID=2582849 RepID=UPI00110F4D68|nr:GyrI-like domain-containing protein [Paenibacillus mesophilus]TMV43346.1 GyrI-like domain-containing protein [Paenibacillus mesophilus]
MTLPEGNNRNAISQKADNLLRERVAEMTYAFNPFFMIGAYLPSQADNWVGLQISQTESISQGMETVTLPAQRYAVKWHYGLRSDVQRTYRRINELLDQVGITQIIRLGMWR